VGALLKNILVIMCLVSQFCWNVAGAAALDYAKGDNWAKADVQSPKVIDCFYIAPTIENSAVKPAKGERDLGVVPI